MSEGRWVRTNTLEGRNQTQGATEPRAEQRTNAKASGALQELRIQTSSVGAQVDLRPRQQRGFSGMGQSDETREQPPAPYGRRPASRKSAVFVCTVLFSVIFIIAVWPTSQSQFRWPFDLTTHSVHTSNRARAIAILKSNPLVDGHNDLAIRIRALAGNHIYGKDFSDYFERGGLDGNVDIPRMNAGEYGGAFWSLFWLCPPDPFDFSDAAYEPIIQATLHQIDLLHRLSARYPKYFPHTPNVAAATSNFYKHNRLISPLAIEGLHQVGNSFANLRLYYNAGVRYATLNWNCHNPYSDAAVLTYGNFSSKPAKPYWGGVSLKGRQMIYEMNRIGMIVDLAHVSVDTMRDVLIGKHNPDFPLNATQDTDKWTGSIAPPIVSHSSAHALCPHPRNVPDTILPLIKQRGSVVMVNFSPDFVSCHYAEDADPAVDLPVADVKGATLEKVVDHITHIGDLIGYEHVGIGSDFDGIESTPKGLEGVDKLPDLVAELLNRGLSEMDVIKVIGGNVLRVWSEVEKVSARMLREGILPAEDDLPSLR